jgi:hypothetical protein
MMAPQKQPDKLRGGVKVTPEQLTDACIQALVSMPGLLQDIIDRLDNMLDALALTALYTERVGLKNGVLTKDDLEGGENGNSDNGSPAGIPADISAKGNG